MTMAEKAKLTVLDTAMIGVGRLGAQSPARFGVEVAKGAQIDMIERRILRIETALRGAGIILDDIG
jgi:hypothetical protein